MSALTQVQITLAFGSYWHLWKCRFNSPDPIQSNPMWCYGRRNSSLPASQI